MKLFQFALILTTLVMVNLEQDALIILVVILVHLIDRIFVFVYLMADG